MWRKLLIACLLGAFGWITAAAAQPAPRNDAEPADRRVALIIGNGGYQHDPLANPPGDARAMSIMLDALGFDVMHHENATRRQMLDALLAFSQHLDAGGVGLVYFAGHGVQLAGKTLLLPVDADNRAAAVMQAEAIDLRTVLDAMSVSRPGKLNIVILDTCLAAPSPTAAGPLPAAADTIIATAAAPGSFAADGKRHGVFTSALLNAMPVPGLSVEEMFRRTASAVRHTSEGRQTPLLLSSLRQSFRFIPAGQDAPAPALALAPQPETVAVLQSRGVLPKDSDEQYELSFWESIKNSTHVSDYEAYLQAYPNGRFASLARARIERLRAAAPKDAPVAKPPPERPRPAPAIQPPPEQARPTPKPAPEQASPAPKAAPPPDKPAAASARVSELNDCAGCPAMVALPGGTFTMGSTTGDPSEKPPRRVTISTPFAIGKYEVTVEQWNACIEAGECPRNGGNPNSQPKNTPVRDVSWDDAQKYVKWLSKTSGHSYRLPTEAEWEYAARGGTSTQYWWGEQMRKGTANCKDCGEPWQQDSPAPVGSFAPNPFGLYDMNGSVWEWVSDCWHNSYKGAPADARAWDDPNCRIRVIRGGSWREGASYMPSSTRFKYDANVRQSQNGFRVARDMK
ncbi:hypothetical protein D3870_05555 [Noviherbaspirillum cavernae]|uniref:Caspase family p20 domain-containing protein n=1 Tax=Noviherbaspirillum cavernae TaxID=2320862 RepID=A0A418X5V4_9BURK|nr:SUMF1/EgtB/PvdO family nonheme iron enzyme [Noviherbaspirillum cavernae]RJG07862.1 hypothetical protein D3870_05555 [Noviherbaspirillum cavernae]